MKKIWQSIIDGTSNQDFQEWSEKESRIIYYLIYRNNVIGYITVRKLIWGVTQAFLISSFICLIILLITIDSDIAKLDSFNRLIVIIYICTFIALSIFFSQTKESKLSFVNQKEIHLSPHRIALIIGNDNYEHYDSLKKQPINDANAIEERLKSMGAEVVKHTNLSYEGIRRAILDFKQKAKGYDDVTFFYAGHGLSYNGKNYLVPTDATPPTTEAELEDLMYAYEQVVKHFADMDGRWNHFFIDACRHTLQFEDRGKPKPMTIGDTEKKELEKWKKRNGKNVCIFFGAAEGEAAYNNRYGNNGIFTTALLKYLIKGITLDDLIKQVTEETQQISGYKQLPYVTATVSGTYVF